MQHFLHGHWQPELYILSFQSTAQTTHSIYCVRLFQAEQVAGNLKYLVSLPSLARASAQTGETYIIQGMEILPDHIGVQVLVL